MTESFVPHVFQPPNSLVGKGFRLEPLGPAHNERDYEAWTSSMAHIQATPGEWRDWPHPMTLAENLADLTRHAREFTERTGFTYSILDGDDVIGCLYIYPDEEGNSDASISSWVRASRAEMDVIVWSEVTEWLRREWPFGEFTYAARA